MARPKSGKPLQKVYRRHTNWSPLMTDLVDQVVQLIPSKRIYFPYSIERGGQTNVAGVIQGVLIVALDHLDDPERWLRCVERYEAAKWSKETKAVNFNEQSQQAFYRVEAYIKSLKRTKPKKVKMGKPPRYPLTITAALYWFIDFHQ